MQPLDYPPSHRSGGMRIPKDAARRQGDLNMCSTRASEAACPGLLHIVEAVDGGLCRIKLAGGRLDAAQARAIASTARSHADGDLEITNRANLQLRGVRAGAAADLVDALTAAGLGPLAAPDAATREARDRRRNVMISPTAGIDPTMRLDTSPLADALLLAMQRDPSLDGLSPKFAIMLDGGETLADLDHPHDIWLRSDPDAPAAAPRLLLGLASAPGTPSAERCPGHVAPQDAVDTVMALLRAFVDLAGPQRARMRQLLAEDGDQVLLARAHGYGARIAPLRLPLPPPALPQRASAQAARRLGAHRQHRPGRFFLGFQAPLARLQADTLEGLATLAEQFGTARLRLTPWQGGLLPDLRETALAPCLAGLQRLGLICDARPALVRLQACAGSPGCARTRADTKRDALRLSAWPLPDAAIHLSGCVRSCAAASPADFTLLATDSGHYDLHQRGPVPGSGPCLARGLTLEQAAAALVAAGPELHDV